MGTGRSGNLLKLLTAVTFVAMIVVNALANILPINGKNTGQISDSYPNLFAPTGLTFAIWGVIYLLLAIFTLYFLGLFQEKRDTGKTGLLQKTGVAFSISSAANAVWIFSWHYQLIPLSMVLMIVILICLIYINTLIGKQQLTTREQVFVRLPFSVYFGWITVATIANATTLLVELGWNGFGFSEASWTGILILAGLAIGLANMLINKDIAYGLVLIWAYVGIWIKHTSASGFDDRYPSVITIVMVSIVLFALAEVYLLVQSRKK